MPSQHSRTDSRPRPARRPSWLFEYISLVDDDYRECVGRRADRDVARHMLCRCGEDMDPYALSSWSGRPTS